MMSAPQLLDDWMGFLDKVVDIHEQLTYDDLDRLQLLGNHLLELVSAWRSNKDAQARRDAINCE